MNHQKMPLLLRPSGKDYLWGGRRLNDEFEKGIELTPLAETWECSTHPDGPCYVAQGTEAISAACSRKWRESAQAVSAMRGSDKTNIVQVKAVKENSKRKISAV